MKVIFVCVWDVIIYTCIINVCQIYLSSFQENIKIHCFILSMKLKINSLLKICEVNISKKFLLIHCLFLNKKFKLRKIRFPNKFFFTTSRHFDIWRRSQFSVQYWTFFGTSIYRYIFLFFEVHRKKITILKLM